MRPLDSQAKSGLVYASRIQAAYLTRTLATHAIALGAERVRTEEERSAPVMERVDVDDDVIVVVDIIPVRDRRADGGGILVVRHNAEVDRIRRVPNEDLGFFLRGAAVHGLVLPEAGQTRSRRPDRLVKFAVDLAVASKRGI